MCIHIYEQTSVSPQKFINISFVLQWCGGSGYFLHGAVQPDEPNQSGFLLSKYHNLNTASTTFQATADEYEVRKCKKMVIQHQSG